MESFKRHNIIRFTQNLCGWSIALALKNAFQHCKLNNWEKIGKKRYLWNVTKRDKKELAVHYYKKFCITHIVILKITKVSIIFSGVIDVTIKKTLVYSLLIYNTTNFLFFSLIVTIAVLFTVSVVFRHNYLKYKWLHWYL